MKLDMQKPDDFREDEDVKDDTFVLGFFANNKRSAIFAEQLGRILIAGSELEEAFRQLVVAASRINDNAAHILTLHASADSLRHSLITFANMRSPHDYYAEELRFCAALSARATQNRNLFAHGSMKISAWREGDKVRSTFSVTKRSARGNIRTAFYRFEEDDLREISMELLNIAGYFHVFKRYLKNRDKGLMSPLLGRPSMPKLLAEKPHSVMGPIFSTNSL